MTVAPPSDGPKSYQELRAQDAELHALNAAPKAEAIAAGEYQLHIREDDWVHPETGTRIHAEDMPLELLPAWVGAVDPDRDDAAQ